MTHAIFPLAMSEEVRLLTAIGLGILFGFSLERGGFGNARKLAAQFYFSDMTVFKVMFTAILVAMVGFYTLAGLGLVDVSMVWINPTFVWGQLVGGFLLGVGFIMSGLCPGTSVVSAASGRYDAMVTFAGIFIGVLLFVVAVDVFPGLERLYEGGSLGVVTLPALLGVSPLWVALAVVAGAVAAFVGAERVERIFEHSRAPVDLTPRMTGTLKWALGGALGVFVFAGITAAGPQPVPAHASLGTVRPLALAQSLIARDPNVMVLDARAERESAPGIPGAAPVALDTTALARLATADSGTHVVVYTDSGTLAEVPASWPTRLHYYALVNGLEGWKAEVLTPVEPEGTSLAELERVNRRNQIAAYFSGAKVETAAAAPPPAMSGGAVKKKKAGGC